MKKLLKRLALGTSGALVLGPALARSIDNNIILNIAADFKASLLTDPANKRELTRTIAHEMVHCLQMHRYGMLKFNPLRHPPLWKQEGYPEYIAYQDEIRSPGYEFSETVKKLLDLEEGKVKWVELKPGHFDPIIYFRGRVLVEYLMDIKGLSFDQVLNDQWQEDEVYGELVKWYNDVAMYNLPLKN